eukprot:2484019-Pyramimonas_sp.AAC.1
MFEPKVELRALFQTGVKSVPPSVVATRSYEKGQLILVALSTNVGIAAKVPAIAVEFRGVCGVPDDLHCFAMSQAATP